MKQSAGLLMYQKLTDLRFFLVHPGGPYFVKKDHGIWTIPKGEPQTGEELYDTALREFKEETGITSTPPYIDLGSIRQAGGKRVFAWAFEWKLTSLPPLVSNTFSMEWPPRSGRFSDFPEIDRGEFFTYNDAAQKINPAQVEFLDKLVKALLQ